MSDPLHPAPGDTGRAGSHLDRLLDDTITGWDNAIAALDSARSSLDLDAPSRQRGRTVRESLLSVGQWPGGDDLTRLREAACNADTSTPPRGLVEAEIRQRFAEADLDRIRQAWLEARAAVIEWRDSGDAPTEAALIVGGPLGKVPLGTLVGASSVALDRALRDAGVEVPAPLAHIAVHSLVDTTGAVCAHSPGDYRLIVVTPRIAVGTAVSEGSWRTALVGPALSAAGPRIEGEEAVILDIAAGRRSPLAAATRREITVSDVPGLLVVARGLATAPDLPGGEGLRTALSTIEGISDGLGGVARRVKSALPGLLPGSRRH